MPDTIWLNDKPWDYPEQPDNLPPTEDEVWERAGYFKCRDCGNWRNMAWCDTCSPETAKYRAQRQAVQAVNVAVMRGELVRQPCIECGEVKVEAHHFDYYQPLDVVWLCRLHHVEVHKLMDRLGITNMSRLRQVAPSIQRYKNRIVRKC